MLKVNNMSKQLLAPGGLTELNVKLDMSASRASDASNIVNLCLVM